MNELCARTGEGAFVHLTIFFLLTFFHPMHRTLSGGTALESLYGVFALPPAILSYFFLDCRPKS